MKLLIGIPTHKRPQLLSECLASIAGQQGPLPDIAVFVADNDPAGHQGIDVVAALAPTYRFPLTGATVEEPGISAVRNAILDEARGTRVDFVAMIDDDVTAEPHWLSMLMERAVATKADVLAGPVFYDLPDGVSDFLRRGFRGDHPPTGPIELINGTTGVLISTTKLQSTQWPRFDAAFGLTGGGDKEWFSRLKGLGARFEWVSAARVVEAVPPSRANLRWFLKRRYRYGIDDIRIDRLHGNSASRRALTTEALGLFGLSPLLLPLLLTNKGAVWLGRLARAWGRVCGLFGAKFNEYAIRHSDPLDDGPKARESR